MYDGSVFGSTKGGTLVEIPILMYQLVDMINTKRASDSLGGSIIFVVASVTESNEHCYSYS